MSAAVDKPADVPASPALDRVREKIAGVGDPGKRVEVLVLALAEAIKATSNDQNVQRLSRDLRAAAGELATAVAGERV